MSKKQKQTEGDIRERPEALGAGEWEYVETEDNTLPVPATAEEIAAAGQQIVELLDQAERLEYEGKAIASTP